MNDSGIGLPEALVANVQLIQLARHEIVNAESD